MTLFEPLLLEGIANVYSADHLDFFVPSKVILIQVIFVHVTLQA